MKIIELPLFYRDRKLTASEVDVVRLIPEGADHKITICCSRKAGDSGYYIAATEDERAHGLQNLKHQANKILEGIEGVAGANLTEWKRLTGFDEVLKDDFEATMKGIEK